jgi:hypothetical protein
MSWAPQQYNHLTMQQFPCIFLLLKMTRPLLTILLLCCASKLFSQSTQTIYYTVKEGLPSNSVYRTILDDRGFLWVATENGIARFDGKKFESYTTVDGLTDNEVVDLFMDSSKTIWVIPFRRSPCYFDQKKTGLPMKKPTPSLQRYSWEIHTAQTY